MENDGKIIWVDKESLISIEILSVKSTVFVRPLIKEPQLLYYSAYQNYVEMKQKSSELDSQIKENRDELNELKIET